MNEISATVLGAFICCIVPLASFAMGIYYARFGLPVLVRWRGFGHPLDDDEV